MWTPGLARACWPRAEPKTPRVTATARRPRSRCQGSRPSRPPAATRQQDAQPGPRLTGTAALTNSGFPRCGSGHKAALTDPRPGSPGGSEVAGRKGDASTDCGNGGIRQGPAQTWASGFPLAQQRFPGRDSAPQSRFSSSRPNCRSLTPLLRAQEIPRGPEPAPAPPPPRARERGSL